ncbi:hypothetical protein Tco_0311854 [Tanacetum coccineum]
MGFHKAMRDSKVFSVRLEIHGAIVSTEDAIKKFLRSLPSELGRRMHRNLNKDGSRTGKKEESKALVTVDGESVDWTTHSEDDENFAFMASNSSGSDTQRRNKGLYSVLKKVEAQLVAHAQGQLLYISFHWAFVSSAALSFPAAGDSAKKINLLKTALNCQYGISYSPQTHLLQKTDNNRRVQERKNKSFWDDLQDFKGKKKKPMRSEDLGLILNNKLRTLLLRQELLNSDYAGANLDRKSTTGGCQFLGRRLITWQCKKQTIVATSTTEAEYVAAASCCGQVLWIQNQMLDYGFNFMNTKIYIDNESTICIVKNPVYHSKTKHIAIRHHFIRDAYEKKLIQVLKIHTDDNVADLLTKAFDVSRFQFLVVSIGMINP